MPYILHLIEHFSSIVGKDPGKESDERDRIVVIVVIAESNAKTKVI